MRALLTANSKYNLLTIIERTTHTRQGVWYLCKCDCGNTTKVLGSKVIRNEVKSCGCLATAPNKTHGLSSTTTYKVWVAMRERCSYTANKCYDSYGGRGITVCDRWKDSFENFYADMGVRPEGLTLDRIDTNGNYEPSNCRWANNETQVASRRDAHTLTINGETKSVASWAKQLGINQATIKYRIKKGLSVDKIIAPVNKQLYPTRSKYTTGVWG